tara:strand:- start:25969 stop:26127 length:159 start_codon:yes stop_codon:yes gene_type:complete
MNVFAGQRLLDDLRAILGVVEQRIEMNKPECAATGLVVVLLELPKQFRGASE